MPSALQEGSTTPTVGSGESSLYTVTTAGVVQIFVDTANMVGGATPTILEVRVYGKARSADTERLIDSHYLVGAQGTPLFVSKPYITLYSLRFALAQPTGSGTAVAFPWSVRAA